VRVRILASGSSGNATLIEAGGTRVLLDGGLGPRVLARHLRAAGVEPDSLAAVVLSHEHIDHIKGAAAFAQRFGVRLMGSRGTCAAGGFAAMERALPGFGILCPGESVALGGLSLTPLAIPHDAAGPLAFVFQAGDAVLGHATDLGHLTEDVSAALAGCDLVVLESNHDVAMLRNGPYPWPLKERVAGPHGHLSNADAARFLAERLGPQCHTVVLAHLSETNNHPEVARMAAESALARAGRGDVRLEVATRQGTAWLEVRWQPTATEGERNQYRLW
jgi:phosphoribosyl 1,2-cyclic phosphodiesterase